MRKGVSLVVLVGVIASPVWAQAIKTDGDIEANAFLGDGAQLTGVDSDTVDGFEGTELDSRLSSVEALLLEISNHTRQFDTVSSANCSDLSNEFAAGSWSITGPGDFVCGESDIPYCYFRGVTWHKTRDICQNIGARLCTQAEIVGGEVAGTGCSHDDRFIYTSTECFNDGFMKVRGDGSGWQCETNLSSTFEAGIRCCADTLTSS